MSVAPRPGWYPDPAGTPELYRWWDGGDWTEAISESPRAPSPRLLSPARAEDEAPRRSPSPVRRVVALLVCVALFLSASAGLGLALWGERGTQRGARGAEPVTAAGGSELGRLDQGSRVATVGRLSMVLPPAPYRLQPDPVPVRGLVDGCFLAWAPVHAATGRAPAWTAAVLVGRLVPGVAGSDLQEQGRTLAADLGRRLVGRAPARVEVLEVADHAVDGLAGVQVRGRVHYVVDGLPSRYDDLTAVLVGLEDGSVAVAASSVPDDADPALAARAAAALASLSAG